MPAINFRFLPSQKHPIFQRQPTVNDQRQYSGPAAGPALRPGHGSTNVYTRGLHPDAPLPENDTIAGPGRDTERILQQQSATYLNAYLAQLTPVAPEYTYKHVHRIKAPLYRDYPQKYAGWWTPRSAFTAPNAYTSLRSVEDVQAPPQLQLTPGGLVVAGYQNEMQNININLAEMYGSAQAPVSASYSGQCK